MIMNLSGYKNIYLTIAFVAGLLFAMGNILKGIRPKSSVYSEELVYEMPRPKGFQGDGGLDLSDRAIERLFKALKRTVFGADENKNSANNSSPTSGGKPVAPGAHMPSNPSQSGRAVGANANATNKAPSKIEVNTVSDSREHLSGRSFDGDVNPPVENGQDFDALPFDRGPIADTTDHTRKRPTRDKKNPNNLGDDEALTVAQWRELMLNHPTPENVRKMSHALASEEIDSESYYKISSEMMASENTETQYLGIFAVNSLPNLRSFVIVSKSYDHLSPQNKEVADSYLINFADQSRIGVLAGALRSGDSEVVLHAGRVLEEGLRTSASSASRSPTGRGGRSDSVSKDPTVYTTLIPILKSLVKDSEDSRIVEMARNLLNQIENL